MRLLQAIKDRLDSLYEPYDSPTVHAAEREIERHRRAKERLERKLGDIKPAVDVFFPEREGDDDNELKGY